jgi:phosphoglycolate phosphatase-like HAD superfamily hydrolase
MAGMRDVLILFDVDGTLIDAGGAGRVAMSRAFREVLQVDGTAPRGSVAYAGRTDPVILDATAAALGIDPRRFRRHREELIRVFVRTLEDEMQRPDPRRRVLPGVLPLLETLDAMDRVHLGLVTGNLERGARAKLEPFGLNRFFPAGGFGSDDPDRRRIARIAHKRLSELAGIAFPVGDVTVVGDTEHDVDCARANGFRAVAVDSGWAERDELERARPDALLDDLAAPRVLEALGLRP